MVYSPAIRQDLKGEWEHFNTFAILNDGGYILAGQTLIKVDPNGNLSWQLSKNQRLFRAYSIAELDNNNGFLILAGSASNNSAEFLQLDPNGNITHIIPVTNFKELPKPYFQQTPDEISIILRDSPSEAYFFKPNGNLTDHVILQNASWTIPSYDGGFVSIGNNDQGDLVNKIILNHEGIVTEQKTSKCSARGCPKLYGDIIHTSDGGYAIMSLVQTERYC